MVELFLIRDGEKFGGEFHLFGFAESFKITELILVKREFFVR